MHASSIASAHTFVPCSHFHHQMHGNSKSQTINKESSCLKSSSRALLSSVDGGWCGHGRARQHTLFCSSAVVVRLGSRSVCTPCLLSVPACLFPTPSTLKICVSTDMPALTSGPSSVCERDAFEAWSDEASSLSRRACCTGHWRARWCTAHGVPGPCHATANACCCRGGGPS